MTERNVNPHAPEGTFDPGPAVMLAMSAAAGIDLLLAEMKALAAILPGQAAGGTAAEVCPEIPGEAEFDDLPV